MFKGVVKGILTLMLVVTTFASQAGESINRQDPYAMMKAAAKQTFARFHTDKAKIAADKDYLKVIVSEELMPYVDYKYAALKVMGRHVRSASPEQRQAFVDAFKGYLIATYAQAFTAYTDQKVEFEPGRDYQGQKQLQVDVNIIEKGRPPVNVAFKMRRMKDNTWKAFDMIAEGVSLLRSKTSEFDGLIRQKGLDNVIDLLNRKAAEKIQNKSTPGSIAA